MITRTQLELVHYHLFSGLWLIVKKEKERRKMKRILWQEFTLQKCFQIMPWVQSTYFSLKKIWYLRSKFFPFYISTHKYNFTKMHTCDHIIHIWSLGAVFFNSLPVQLGFPLPFLPPSLAYIPLPNNP